MISSSFRERVFSRVRKRFFGQLHGDGAGAADEASRLEIRDERVLDRVVVEAVVPRELSVFGGENGDLEERD